MSDPALTIATALSGQTTLSIVVGSIPATMDDAIGIRLNDGASPSLYFATEEPIQYPLLQVHIRSSTYPVGYSDAESIRAFLNRYSDTSSGILSVLQVGSTMHLGRNEKNQHEFQLHFKITM